MGNERLHVAPLLSPVWLAKFRDVLDSNDNNPHAGSTLHVPGSTKQSSHPNSGISSLTHVPTASLVTTDQLHPTANTESGRLHSDRMSWLTDSLCPLDQSSGFSSSPGSLLATSMQHPTNSATGSSTATGLVAPTVHSHPSLNMQSTTPSTANDKDEMRGWLYKWTNVN